jgi:hypothetical protein
VGPLLIVLFVQAQVYSWTDKSGVEHFTDDLKSLPRGVKVRTTEGAEISRIENEVKKAQVVQAPVAQPQQQRLANSGDPAVPSVSEEVWRRLFRDARNKVINLEDEIESDRKKVEEVNGLPVTARFNCQTGFYPYYPAFGQQVIVNGGTLTAGGQLAPGLSVNGTVSSTALPRSSGTGRCRRRSRRTSSPPRSPIRIRWQHCASCMPGRPTARWWRWSPGPGCSRRALPNSSGSAISGAGPRTAMHPCGIETMSRRTGGAGRPAPRTEWAPANAVTTPKKSRAGR